MGKDGGTMFFIYFLKFNCKCGTKASQKLLLNQYCGNVVITELKNVNVLNLICQIRLLKYLLIRKTVSQYSS